MGKGARRRGDAVRVRAGRGARERAAGAGRVRGAVSRLWFFGSSAVSVSPGVPAAAGVRAVGRRREGRGRARGTRGGPRGVGEGRPARGPSPPPGPLPPGALARAEALGVSREHPPGPVFTLCEGRGAVSVMGPGCRTRRWWSWWS